MKIAIERNFEAVGDSVWTNLVRKSSLATVFQSWDWQYAWWRAFYDAVDSRELLLICAYGDDGALLALAPLMADREGGRRVIRFAGDGRADSLDIICDDGAAGARESVLEQLRQQRELWDVLELNRIPERSPTVRLVKEWSGRSGFSDQWGERASAAALIVGKQQADHAASFAIVHTHDSREIIEQLDAFFIQHIHRWSAYDVQSQFVIRANRQFYRHLVEQPILRGERSGALRFTTIRSGAKPVAYALGILGRGQLWCDISSDILEAGNRVERVLIDALLALARDNGADELALARGDDLHAGSAPANVRYRVSVRVTKERPGLGSRLTRSAPVARAAALTSEMRQVAHVAMNASHIVDSRKKRSELGASHRDYYDAGSITRQYVRETRLQKPEQVILHELQPLLAQMRVLDVGVGAGRTVPYFGTIARDYHGFDFAPNMVTACQRLTGDLVDPSRIAVGDARDMRDVPDASCDLVLISYNAIDDIGGEADRFKVLAEVRRVAAAGAYFCFSSHNMKSLTPDGATGFLPRLRRWRRYRLLRAANPGLHALRKEPHAMIHDVGMDYRFPHYYIAPSAQARQLADFGFTNVRVFSVNSGVEIRQAAQWDDLIDSWVYYLCRVPALSPDTSTKY